MQDSLRELAETYELVEVAFDPRYIESAMDVVADRLGQSAVFPVEPHSRLHREALATFERQVLEGVIRHAGRPGHRRAVGLDGRRTLRERGPAPAP